MTIANTVKLFFKCFLQIFNVIFFMLLSFVIYFGVMMAFSPSYFSALVGARLFDNLFVLFQSFFIKMNINSVISSCNLIFESLREVIAFNSTAFVLSIIFLVLVLICLLTWLKYSGNKRALESIEQDAVLDENYLSIIRKLIFQCFFETILNVILYAFILSAGYYISIALINLGVGGFGGFVLLALLFILMLGIKKFFICCWSHVCMVENLNWHASYARAFETVFNKGWATLLNAIILVTFNFLLILLFAQINFIVTIIALAIAYVLNTCFGAVVYNKSFQNNQKTII